MDLSQAMQVAATGMGLAQQRPWAATDGDSLRSQPSVANHR
jgi:hypothetical protein